MLTFASRLPVAKKAIIGVMVESHLVEGNQSLESGEPLAYGKSITDACIGWDDTDALLRQLANAVKSASRVIYSRIAMTVRLQP